MSALSLAWRNLTRNRRRSIAALLSLIVGACAILLFGGYSRNIAYGLETSFVQQQGHLQIQHKDYFLFGKGNPATYGIRHYQAILDAVRRDAVLAPMLTVATPVLEITGIAGQFSSRDGASRTVVGSGTVVEDQGRMREWNDYNFPLQRPPLALAGTSEDSAVVGIGVARVLALCDALELTGCLPRASAASHGNAVAITIPEDVVALAHAESPEKPAAHTTRIEMLAANVHGAPNVASLNVVKAESQGVKEFDDIYVGLHLAQAQKLVFGKGLPQVTAIAIQLRHTSQMPAARARLQQLLQAEFANHELAVLDFATLHPFYGQSIALFGAIFGFLSLLIGAIVLFTVSNTMRMAVVERTAEIGTLRALGVRRNGIRQQFVCEGLLLGLVGVSIGGLIAVLLSMVLNQSGLTWTPPGRVTAVPLQIFVWGETWLLVGSAIGLILVTVLSACWPAARAARLDVVDALRHV